MEVRIKRCAAFKASLTHISAGVKNRWDSPEVAELRPGAYIDLVDIQHAGQQARIRIKSHRHQGMRDAYWGKDRGGVPDYTFLRRDFGTANMTNFSYSAGGYLVVPQVHPVRHWEFKDGYPVVQMQGGQSNVTWQEVRELAYPFGKPSWEDWDTSPSAHYMEFIAHDDDSADQLAVLLKLKAI